MYVIGTSGHVDHGKSSLVKALTGMDPDRLTEERLPGELIWALCFERSPMEAMEYLSAVVGLENVTTARKESMMR